MKSYKETTDSIFDKSEQIMEARRKRKKALAAVSGVLGACAILVVCIGVWRREQVRAPLIPSDNTEQITTNIMINELGSSPAAAGMDIAISWEDRTVKTREELQAYYGTDIYPTVLPRGFIEEILEGDDFSVFLREGQGVYYDQNTITYFSEEAMAEYKKLGYNDWSRPTVSITFSKVKDIYWDYFDLAELAETPSLQTSVIHGHHLLIFKYNSGNGTHYLAYFTKDGVHFAIDGSLISESEFIEVLKGYFME